MIEMLVLLLFTGGIVFVAVAFFGWILVIVLIFGSLSFLMPHHHM